MIRLWKLILFFGGAVTLPIISSAQENESTKALVVPMGRSVGINKWVAVEGRNVRLRKALSVLADDTAESLAKLLGERSEVEGMRSVLVVMSERGKGNSSRGVRPYVQPLDGGQFLIGMHVDTRGEIDRALFGKGLIEALIYERSLRGKRVLDEGQGVSVPQWLVTGLSEAIVWEKDQSNRRIYSLLRDRPELFSIAEALKTNGRQLSEFDDTKRSFYQASSCALVMSMLRQKGGADGLRKLLSEVALFEGEWEELFRKYFPGMNEGEKGVEKLWSLQVANMAVAKLSESLSIQETEERLRKLLYFNEFDENGVGSQVPLSDFSKLKDLTIEQRVACLTGTRAELVQLSYRCFQTYRPILLEYNLLTRDLIQGKDDKVALTLEKLEKERSLILTASERTRDYLDWYQISQAREVKGDFRGYMKLKERLIMEREKRKDPVIDKYLDEVQDFFTPLEVNKDK